MKKYQYVLIAALLLFWFLAMYLLIPGKSDYDAGYETGVEVGRQMLLEAIEGEPGYCAIKPPISTVEV